MPNKMGGWKTVTGIIVGVTGGALLAGAEVANEISYNLYLWMRLIGTILSFAGGGLGAYGIAHKSHKNTERIEAAVKNKQGFIAWPVLAGIMAALAAVVIGCALYQPTDPICNKEPYATGSLICKKTAEYGTSPEALNGVLLDTAAIDVVAQPGNRDDICEFLATLRDYYHPNMIWSELIGYLELSADQNIAINAIIQRRIPIEEYSVVRFIGPADDDLLRRGWKQHWDQLRCGDL